jgi:hypothetical protein
MFKETHSSLRRYFALVAFLCLAASLPSIFIRGATGPFLFGPSTVVVVLNGVAFAYVAARFGTLIVKSPGTIRAVLHVSFWADCLFGISFGRFPTAMSDRIGWVVAAIIYVYLLRSVTRISDEQNGNLPNQSTDPTLSSVTPAAGQPPRLP